MLDDSPDTRERPRLELEAEVGALKCQLSTAQALVSQTFNQMAMQKERTKQLIAAWKVRLGEGEERLRKQRAELDAQMQLIVSDLFLFEGALKREQKEIQAVLHERDRTILAQKRTIESLTVANASLVASLKKMKKKYKSKQMANNAEDRPVFTPEGSRTIQEEADAIIREMFGTGHLDGKSSNCNNENSRVKNATAGSEQTSEGNQGFTDVCFYLTETKDEHAQSAMKLHRNKASTKRVEAISSEAVSLLDDAEPVTLNSDQLPEGQPDTEALKPLQSGWRSSFSGSSNCLDAIVEEKAESREGERKWSVNGTNLFGLLQDDENANIDAANQRCESEPGYQAIFFSKNIVSSEGSMAASKTHMFRNEEELYQNFPVTSESGSSTYTVCRIENMELNDNQAAITARDTGHHPSRKSYDVT